MRGLTIHAVVFAVVNALLVAAWLVTTGSNDILTTARSDPLAAFRDGMWPVAVIAVWGGGLVIHLTVVLTAAPRKLRRRVRDLAKEQHRARARGHHAPPAPPAPPAAPGARHHATSGHDFGQHVAQAALDFVDNLSAKNRKPKPTEPGRQLVTVMFTDLVGSTDLTERLGDATWHRILGEHRALVRASLVAHGGSEVGTQGDGFLVRFPSPDAGVACAVDIQRQMGAHRDGGSFTPELRVGIHAGEAMADDEDLVGRVINLASRVTSAAGPSEILVTEPVADHVSPGVVLVDRGLVSLKGIAQARHLFAVDWRPDSTEDAIDVTDADEDASDPTPG
jgi:class 3 adenylate cyclase